MNYTELVASVTSWLNRNNFAALTSEIPTFFALAQERIDTDPQFRLISLWVNTTIDTATPTLPADFSKGIAAIIDDEQGSEVRGAPVREVMARQFQNGKPAIMAPVGTEFIFAPSPNQTYSISLTYQKSLTRISDSIADNELTTTYPSLILWAVLTEALMWLKDDQRAAVWEGRYRETLAKIALKEEEKQYPGGSLKVVSGYNTGFETVRANSY